MNTKEVVHYMSLFCKKKKKKNSPGLCTEAQIQIRSSFKEELNGLRCVE